MFHDFVPARRANAPYEPRDPRDPRSAPNLLRGAARTSASGEMLFSPRGNALNGNRETPTENWGADHLPAWLLVDMGRPVEINAVAVWPYWDGVRWYQYAVEGSADGRRWTRLLDRRRNTARATPDGDMALFATRKLRFVRATVTGCSSEERAHIVQLEAYRIPDADAKAARKRSVAWSQVAPGLHGAVGSTDARPARDEVPAAGGRWWRATAWRGERASAQFVLHSASGARQVRVKGVSLAGPDGVRIPADAIRARFVRYVLAEGRLVPDVLDTAERLNIPPNSVRPLWLTVDVPHAAKAGVYRGHLSVAAEGGAEVRFALTIEVLPRILPPPADWEFHLDIWQNPYAVARYHGVAPWSEEHFRILEPHLRMLADAGQKRATTTIIDDAWRSQTYDPHDSMVRWIRGRDGSWRFDFSVFDRYVDFAAKCGITGGASCYTLVPWTNSVAYEDEETGETRHAGAVPSTASYDEVWRPFLKRFAAHLKRRGLLGRTVMGVDERSTAEVMETVRLVRDSAPALKTALGGHYDRILADHLDDYSVGITQPVPREVMEARAAKGWTTTFYICCGPGAPNTFTLSPPAEAEWLGLMAAGAGYSGVARWAYDSWTADPLHDTNHVTWAAGDCFLVYPGARSSIRFERLRDGIQDYEKIRLLREAAARRRDPKLKAAVAAMDRFVGGLSFESFGKTPVDAAVKRARALIDRASRAASPRN